MKYSPQIWNQLKNITKGELAKALTKSGWERDEGSGNIYVYRHQDGRRITIHFHPQQTLGPNLLKDLLEVIHWTEKDLRKLKLIK